jgi:hypothetical protein
MSTATAEAPVERREFTVYGAAKSYGSATGNKIRVPDSLRLLKDGEEPDAEEFMFRVCTPEAGDERITFNPYRIQELAEAKKLFNELIKKGYYAYRIDPDSGGRGGEIVRRFEDIIGDGEVIMSEIRPPVLEQRTASRVDVVPRKGKAEVVMHPRPVGG